MPTRRSYDYVLDVHDGVSGARVRVWDDADVEAEAYAMRADGRAERVVPPQCPDWMEGVIARPYPMAK